MDLAIPLLISGSGVAIATVAFINRDKPAWQQAMRRLLFVAIMQIVIGAVAWVLLSR